MTGQQMTSDGEIKC